MRRDWAGLSVETGDWKLPEVARRFLHSEATIFGRAFEENRASAFESGSGVGQVIFGASANIMARIDVKELDC